MRTTVDLDADVLEAVKDLARARGQTFGRVLSDVARKGMVGGVDGLTFSGALTARDSAAKDIFTKFGFEPLPVGGKLVGNALVDQIRDEEGL